MPTESLSSNIVRLTNQLWKLIPMRENEEDWEKQLRSVIIQISGLNEVFLFNPLFLQLLCKLEGLAVEETDFEDYRKTIFEGISLLQRMLQDEEHWNKQ